MPVVRIYSSPRFWWTAATQKVASKFALAAVLCFLITMTIGYFLPIYTDEITYKIIQARYFIDGFVNITLLPQCGPSFTATVPFFMIPARMMDAWLYEDLSNPMKLRVIGIGNVLIWCVALLALLPRCMATQLDRKFLIALIVCFLGIGALPYVVMYNRPESVLLWCFSLAIIAPLYFQNARSRGAQYAFSAFFVFISAEVVAVHPKSLLFMPLLMTSAFFLIKPYKLKAIICGCMLYFAGAGYSYWISRTICPNDAEYEQISRMQLIPLSNLLTDPIHTVLAYLSNAVGSAQYFWHLRLGNVYGHVGWLPPNDAPDWLLSIVNVAIFTLFKALILALVVAVISSLIAALRRKGEDQLSVRRFAVTAACLVSLAALGTTQGVKNFYEAGLVVPLIGLLLILNVRFAGSLQQIMWKGFAGAVVLVSMVSQFTLWLSFVPVARSAPAGYQGEDQWAVSFSGYETLKPTIVRAASACNIAPKDPLKHLVIDDLTYPVFQQSFQPFHITYLSKVGGPDWKAHASGKIFELLKTYRSDGVIVGCQSLPADMRRRATQSGEFCCISSNGIER